MHSCITELSREQESGSFRLRPGARGLGATDEELLANTRFRYHGGAGRWRRRACCTRRHIEPRTATASPTCVQPSHNPLPRCSLFNPHTTPNPAARCSLFPYVHRRARCAIASPPLLRVTLRRVHTGGAVGSQWLRRGNERREAAAALDAWRWVRLRSCRRARALRTLRASHGPSLPPNPSHTNPACEPQRVGSA
jgi:hypothetical protein